MKLTAMSAFPRKAGSVLWAGWASQWLLLLLIFQVPAAEMPPLTGHVPAVVKQLASNGPLPGTNYLSLAIGLPLRNQPELTNLLAQIYDRTSTNYHHYLNPAQFAGRFGPSAGDYQSLMAYVQAKGLTVAGTHANRLLLDVRGQVSQIEQAFHVNLLTYPHPHEQRNFYAPDNEPSLDLAVPILHISGLDNYLQPRPMSLRKTAEAGRWPARPLAGSGPGGTYMGQDFRKAYLPGTVMTGMGQQVGLLQLQSGYYQSDIDRYKRLAGLPDVPVTPVMVDGYDGSAGMANDECSLDIEMVISMAPGLSQVLVYEGVLADDILNQMATDNLARQLSSSWLFTVDPNTENIFLQFAAQGQSFFNASGDFGTWVGGVDSPADDPYLTSVGGTTLTTDTNGNWVSENVWNWGSTNSSGGGISPQYDIPSWQQGVDMTLNQGSTTMRNIPDVALTADNINVVYGDGTNNAYGGTSCAAPLWAGFAALINQQAADNSVAPVGFLNPAIYALGGQTNYSSVMHDILLGNNTNAASGGLFYAVAGYDLCTGWGTPAGQSLIDALVGPASHTPAFVITQPTNQTATFGETVNFYVLAGGLPPFSYQWSFNGTNLAGATNATLTLGGVQSGQAGEYQVLVTNAFGSVLSSNASLVVKLPDHFVWSTIPSPRFVDAPFAVTIQAQTVTNGIDTNFTGTVNLSSTLGIPIQPPVSGAFFMGGWTGPVMVAQPATNLVLTAIDGLGETGSANAINILSPPVLTGEQYGSVLVVFWPTNIGGFVVQTAAQMDASNWVQVVNPPLLFGNQNLEAFPLTGSQGFYRLSYKIP